MKNIFVTSWSSVPFLALVLSGLVSSSGCSSGNHRSDESAAQDSAAHAAVWSLDSFNQPEGVYYDSEAHVIYVSNQGHISEVALNGQMIQSKLVTGLSSPAGMKITHKTLWVASGNELVGVALPASKKTPKKTRIQIKGAQCLNGIDTVAGEGKQSKHDTFYVTDNCSNQIFKVYRGKASVFIKNTDIHSPAGVLVRDGKLYVTSSDSVAKTGDLYSVDLKTKKVERVTKTSLGMLHGLDMDSSGQFIVSESSSGKVNRVSPDGSSKLILEQPGNLASISFVPELNLLLISVSSQNTVKAYLYDKL